MKNVKIIIIGGGLSGLATAWYLEKNGMQCTIIEARNRLGGRIYTLRKSGCAPLEMGATWLGMKHKNLAGLLKETKISIFEQYMGQKAFFEENLFAPPKLIHLPYNPDPSYRISGGTDVLIDSLSKKLKKSTLILGQPVKSIAFDKKMIIRTVNDQYEADTAVAAMPPKLLLDTISFTPGLPDELARIASSTHSWMAESIKFGLAYENPFWRDVTTSGTIMSNTGPVTEMYDHSSESQPLYALTGFINPVYHSMSKVERKNIVLRQLQGIYGKKAVKNYSYYDLVWRDDPFTYSEYESHVNPHQNNGHTVFSGSFYDGHFLIAGAETATGFPGYMDGAAESAKRVAKKITSQYS